MVIPNSHGCGTGGRFITGVPTITHTATIAVRGSAQAAFAVVARDLLAVEDDPKAMVRRRPLDEGPLRQGFRWQQSIVHDRRECHADWLITELRAPWLLEQAMEHLCEVAKRKVVGGERWELKDDGDGSTVVTLRAWRLSPGPLAWLRQLLRRALGDAEDLSLRRRLAFVQFEAERSAPSQGG
jgi:hypothetical protein